MKERDASLDVLRILACFLVVLMHSPLPSENADGAFLNIINFVTAPCIGLFFMVSGALLLPVKTEYFSFIHKRFSKILVPTLLWSFIYICLKLFDGGSDINLWQTLASIPFSAQGDGVLWFMYTLAGLYLLAPILSRWIEKASKKEIEFILILWAITQCYPILNFWLTINTSTAGVLYYFTGYVGYFLMGYYLYRYPKVISLTICCIITIIGGILLLFLKKQEISFDFFSLFCYGSIFCSAFAIAIWKGVRSAAKALDSNPLWGGYPIVVSEHISSIFLLCENGYGIKSGFVQFQITLFKVC